MSIEIKVCQQQKIYAGRVQYAAVLQMGQAQLRQHLEKEILENPLARWKQPPLPPVLFEVQQEPTLKQELGRQIPGLNCDTRTENLCRQLLEDLDADGYFREDIAEVAARLRVPRKAVEDCLSLLQSLEPAGVFAKDLAQCLLLQLQRLPRNTEPEQRIAEKYLPLLGKGRLDTIARALQLPLSRIEEAAKTIRSLQPKPAAGYAVPGPAVFVIPELTVTADCQILPGDWHCPELTEDMDYRKDLGELDRETRQYLCRMRHRLRQLQTTVERRNNTVLRMTEFLVRWQEDWFRGQTKLLRPLRMADAAWELGLSVSAVSRCVKDKYIRCCHGLIPMQRLFAKGVTDPGKGTVLATQQIKDMLSRLVEAEDPAKPLSDQLLCSALRAKGVNISRRAVTKYRLNLAIPDSRARKQNR